MIDWLKKNRLKGVAISALSGSVFMGLAGGVGLLNVSFENAGYALLSVGGLVSSFGHITLMLWGKGSAEAEVDTVSVGMSAQHDMSPMLRPLFPWRYPLDSGFVAFMLGNANFIIAGFLMSNYALATTGLFAVMASLIGWLWPQEKSLCGFNSMQLSAICYLMATISNFVAAFWDMDIMLLAASCCFLASNAILYTIRKETQSSYTQAHN